MFSKKLIRLSIFTLLTVLSLPGCISSIGINDPNLMDAINQPVIGILTIFPSDKIMESIGKYDAYVPSSYKKWVEQSGARAIPIPHFLPKATILKLLNQVNGILFPGGAPELIL